MPSRLIVVSTASLVVPAISDTIRRLSPKSLLISDDLPTFGFPTIATLGLSSSNSSSSIDGKFFVISSSNSPKPCLDAADTGIGSPKPKL